MTPAICATVGAKLMGATTIIAVESVAERAKMARQLGADHVIDFKKTNPVEEVKRLTDGRGVDVAIEALGAHKPRSRRVALPASGRHALELGRLFQCAYYSA